MFYRTLEEIGRNQKQYKTALGAGDRKFESFYPDQLKASQSNDCEAFFIDQNSITPIGYTEVTQNTPNTQTNIMLKKKIDSILST